jgi:hypothetical protein
MHSIFHLHGMGQDLVLWQVWDQYISYTTFGRLWMIYVYNTKKLQYTILWNSRCAHKWP